MQKPLLKKGIAVAVIVLFIGMIITPSTGTVLEKSSFLSLGGKTLYVGGSGPGNYSKINDAYNDANPGDTIFVYSGIYYERLRIKKTVNLIGEDKDTTSIIYNSKHWDPIKIWATNAVISGFKIYNPNPDLISYLTLYNGSNNVSISDCIFYNSPLHFDKGSVGICICDSSHHRISNCTFLYNDDEGICLNKRSSHNIVENCVFSHCGSGIEFLNSSHNIVDNCLMKDGHSGIFMGRYNGDIKSNNNLIKNCDIYNNEQYGIILSDAYNNVIYNCSLDNNRFYGIKVTGSDSYNNLIINNKIDNSIIGPFGKGLHLEDACHDNTFSNNHISNCDKGAYIDVTFSEDCIDNLFYHNNFIDNNRNAYDECDNLWDNGYPSGGNYWDDYTGVDNDSDGIGDTPYNISGDNKDYYPLMEPWIKDEVTVGANGPYYGLINEPIQFHGLAIGGYKPYTWLWDFGDTYTSEEQNPSHTYTDAGKFDVVLNVTDSHGNSSSDITFAWIQETNDPPSKPSIEGETNGKIKTEYNYTFLSSDPEGLHIWYFIDWRDGTNTGWIGPYKSGEEITKSHAWSEKGDFVIRCKAKDPYGAESEWGELRVTMPYNYHSNWWFMRWLDRFPLLQCLLGWLIW
ncbi:MAG: right-handed parallel beta-helix repeat-containing protein [Thermoplasmatales archaeon]|nr:MAG: right-handed parallel beta-helix repeat-containing protein [Thermoplasmatales archaeon]